MLKNHPVLFGEFQRNYCLYQHLNGETNERHYWIRAFFRAACLSKRILLALRSHSFQFQMESPKEGRGNSPLTVTVHRRNGNQGTVSQKDPNKSRAESCLSSLLAPCLCKAGVSSVSSVLFLTTADSRTDGSMWWSCHIPMPFLRFHSRDTKREVTVSSL